MELRDYIRMLRRGWPAIVLITALFAGVAALYVAVAPKRYESGTMLFVSGQTPQSTGDLSEGNSFALSAAVTYAKIMTSDAVLGPAAASLQPPRSASSLFGSVDAVVPEDTTLIVITAASSSPDEAASVANAVAGTAARIIPGLQVGDTGRPLVQMQQLQPAVAPTEAVSPNVKRVIALGFVVGFVVGLAFTISAQTLDTRIRRADDLRELTDVPLLAEIPHRKRAPQHALAVRDDPTGATGEAFRTLRTNLGFMEPRDRRSLVFASVVEDRNGAQVPANLAWSLARAGWSVLLIDLDLRRSAVGEAIGIRAGTGLADVLLGQRNLPEVINDTSEARLRVVTAGTPQSSPSDLLTGPAMNNLLRRMEQENDYVILHAPPLLSSTDAALVSRAAGASFVTVAVGRTRAQELTTAVTALANVRIKPLGMIVTGTRRLEGLAGLVRSGIAKQRHRPGTVGTFGPRQAAPSLQTDGNRRRAAVSSLPAQAPAQSPAQSTLRMMPPQSWSGTNRPASPPLSPRPVPPQPSVPRPARPRFRPPTGPMSPVPPAPPRPAFAPPPSSLVVAPPNGSVRGDQDDHADMGDANGFGDDGEMMLLDHDDEHGPSGDLGDFNDLHSPVHADTSGGFHEHGAYDEYDGSVPLNGSNGSGGDAHHPDSVEDVEDVEYSAGDVEDSVEDVEDSVEDSAEDDEDSIEDVAEDVAEDDEDDAEDAYDDHHVPESPSPAVPEAPTASDERAGSGEAPQDGEPDTVIVDLKGPA